MSDTWKIIFLIALVNIGVNIFKLHDEQVRIANALESGVRYINHIEELRQPMTSEIKKEDRDL